MSKKSEDTAMRDGVIIGVNILEILTTGMYRDSRVIFREYIQNSCDQIDVAVRDGLLVPNEGRVELWVDADKRFVSIEDNATGIPSDLFRQTLYSIGESTKTLGEDKGFRGIGHWCGLGYAKSLVFTSKAKGENVESIMSCNAEEMRGMMNEHNSHKAHYSVDDVLTATVKFSTRNAPDIHNHYFKVEMFDIRDAHAELYTLQQVKDYLSFVAPVAYTTAFHFKNDIHKHANLIQQPIQEYNVSVRGESIFKKYTPSFTTSKGEDKITAIDFRDFKDDDGNLIAWLWFGVSRFQGVLKKENQMRGIRLRTQNIQIGNDDALQKLFNEDRGQHYFVGEVFAITKDLIPNSQRDYFNGNEARLQFERELSSFFNDDLSRIYKAGSTINSKYDKIDKAEQIEVTIATAKAEGKSISKEQHQQLKRAKKEAEHAKIELEKMREKVETKRVNEEYGIFEIVVGEIIKSNEEKRAHRPSRSVQLLVEPKQHLSDKAEDKFIPLSKIRKIIYEFVDSATAQIIIDKLEENID